MSKNPCVQDGILTVTATRDPPAIKGRSRQALENSDNQVGVLTLLPCNFSSLNLTPKNEIKESGSV